MAAAMPSPATTSSRIHAFIEVVRRELARQLKRAVLTQLVIVIIVVRVCDLRDACSHRSARVRASSVPPCVIGAANRAQQRNVEHIDAFRRLLRRAPSPTAISDVHIRRVVVVVFFVGARLAPAKAHCRNLCIREWKV